MDEILKYIVENVSFLYKEFGFKFVDSNFSNTFGGEGFITLQSNNIELRFVNDRNQLFLDFRSTKFDKKDNWHSSDVLKQLVTGNICDSSVLDDHLTVFVRERFGDILDLFSSSRAKATVSQLNKLELERLKDCSDD